MYGIDAEHHVLYREPGRYAGCPDLGYPRIVERPDGRVVAVYYWNDALVGERYIGVSIFTP